MKTKVIAKAVLFREDGKLLALRRSNTDVRRPLQWDLPGGMVDDGEDFTEAACREIDEEAGLQVKPDDLQLIFCDTGIRNDTNIVWMFFVGKVKDTVVKISYEHDKAEWMELAEAIDDFDYAVQKKLLSHIKQNQLQLN